MGERYSDRPTTADYASAAADHATSDLKDLRERVKELEARLTMLEVAAILFGQYRDVGKP